MPLNRRIQMNQKCTVCKEPAAGFHFGAFTCEGCKSFFGRTYNNLSSVPECKNGRKCEINKKNRTSCKACRLEKCLSAGMSKSSSRYGRRPNSFKATYASGHAQEDKQSEEPRSVSPLGLYPPILLSPPCNGVDNETDAASTVQKNSTSRINDVANFHDRFFMHNWCGSFQPPLSTTPPSISQIASLPISNQIQRQSLMQYCSLPVLSKSNPSLMESQSRNTSDNDSSDNERLHDVEYKSNSSRVSPFTFTNKIDEPTLSSLSVNGSLMLTNTHNYLYSLSIPSVITPTAYSAKGGDSLLVSPNPGGLADERDEPIDLSIRGSSRLSNNESSEKKEEKEKDQINDTDSSTKDCAVDPLDLTLDIRPIIRSLRSTRSYRPY